MSGGGVLNLTSEPGVTVYEQGDQLFLVVCFWYLAKRDLSSVQ